MSLATYVGEPASLGSGSGVVHLIVFPRRAGGQFEVLDPLELTEDVGQRIRIVLPES